MLDAIKKLREKTGAGVVACQQALKEANGDIEKAVELLRKKGIASASKKACRITKEGVIESYVHMGGKIGVLVELNCETDFVGRNEEFRRLAKELAMQVAASRPSFLKREDVPKNILDKEIEIIKSQVSHDKSMAGKPKAALDKIAEGKLEKFYEDACLLEQPFIKDPSHRVKDIVAEVIGKIGENIVIRRFSRFQLGEEE